VWCRWCCLCHVQCCFWCVLCVRLCECVLGAVASVVWMCCFSVFTCLVEVESMVLLGLVSGVVCALREVFRTSFVVVCVVLWP